MGQSQKMVTNDESLELLDALIARYQGRVYTQALHLTGNEDVATEVTEEVFVALSKETGLALDNCAEKVEALTYDFALGRLMSSIKEHHDEVDSYCRDSGAGELGTIRQTKINVDSELSADQLVDATATLDKARDLLRLIIKRSI